MALATCLVLSCVGTAATAAPVDISSGSGGFVNSPAAGAFADLYTFTLAAAATMTAIVSSSVAGGQDVDFTSLVLTGPSGPQSFSLINPDPFEIWTIGTGVLAPGSYTLTASGSNSAAIGTYAGTIALSATGPVPPGSVPVPGSWALILMGLGVSLWASRRRTNRTVCIAHAGSVADFRADR